MFFFLNTGFFVNLVTKPKKNRFGFCCPFLYFVFKTESLNHGSCLMSKLVNIVTSMTKEEVRDGIDGYISPGVIHAAYGYPDYDLGAVIYRPPNF